MIYKVLNKLFGWDYIAWDNSADQGVARIFRDGLGNPYYWRYKNIKLVDRLNYPTQVIWLTCPPSKYLKEKNE